jgi:transposase
MFERMGMPRRPYPTDVSDEEWSFVAPYLALVREDAAQRKYVLREVFNAARWMVRAGRRVALAAERLSAVGPPSRRVGDAPPANAASEGGRADRLTFHATGRGVISGESRGIERLTVSGKLCGHLAAWAKRVRAWQSSDLMPRVRYVPGVRTRAPLLARCCTEER